MIEKQKTIPKIRDVSKFNNTSIVAGSLAAISTVLAVLAVSRPSNSSMVEVQLEQMIKTGVNFNPDPLHAMGARGLAEVLAAFSERHAGRDVGPTGSFAAGFEVYASGIDDHERLLLLAQHLRIHLREGVPHLDDFFWLSWKNHDRTRILQSCVEALRRNDQDKHAVEYSAVLAPSLSYSKGHVGIWLIRQLDDHNNGLPLIAYALKVEALDSEYPDLVNTGLKSATECAILVDRQIVHERLIKIFNGTDEENKFHACFPLMHQFQHQEAIGYLLQQTGSADRKRARTATVWIGDACNWGQIAYPALLDALDSLLNSEDQELRYLAVKAISTYAGSEATIRLLGALADEDPRIVELARRQLIRRATGLALREENFLATLERFAETHESAQVRDECFAIVEAVEKRSN